jgi:DNA-binding transcriptional ArsR family regulator
VRQAAKRECAALKALDDQAMGYVAEYFRALSEPLRLKILNALRDRARNVGELTELLGSSQANVSKHLATLTRLGFVERSAQGTSAFYRIADPRIYQLCDLVCDQMARRFATQAQMLGARAGAASNSTPGLTPARGRRDCRSGSCRYSATRQAARRR